MAPPRPEPSVSDAPSGVVIALAAALLVGGGAYGIGFWLLHDSGPQAAAFAPAAEVIRGSYLADDLIILAPPYATRAREVLGDLRPVNPRFPLHEDLDIRARVWVFALFGAEREVGASLEAAGFIEAFAHNADGIAIRRYERTPRARVAYDFVAALPRAKVAHDQGGGREAPCDRWERLNHQGGPGGRWVCRRDGEWFYVGEEWHRMGDQRRRCLWAHPPNQGRLVVRFADVPLRGVLTVRGGHTLNASRRARAPVHLDVNWGARVPQRLTFALEDHFRPFRLKIPTATTATVTFAVSSPDAGVNHFCFVADVREVLP